MEQAGSHAHTLKQCIGRGWKEHQGGWEKKIEERGEERARDRPTPFSSFIGSSHVPMLQQSYAQA